MTTFSEATERIRFSADQIPTLSEPLPILRLGSPVLAPEHLLAPIVAASGADATLAERGEHGLRAAFAGKRLIAYVHPQTGESAVYPSLESLEPGRALARHATAAAERLVGEASLFPADATTNEVLAPVTLYGATHAKGGERGRPAEYLAYVRVQRRVGEHPVFGPGSKAMVGVAADGSLRAFAHRRRAAAADGRHVAPHPRAAIHHAILEQLAPSATTASDRLEVTRVSVGYYDGGRELLQPVYRFEATIHSEDVQVADRHLLGYVSIGEAPEPLPSLSATPEHQPSEPPARSKRPAGTPEPVGPAPSSRGSDPTVGRYVVRDDSPAWVASANSFMENLELAQGLFGGLTFTNSQYYWAEPFEFYADRDSFVNSVQIALNEVHGNWNLFSTEKNDADFVYLTDVPAGGYGSGGGGSLAFWILHSCEVIPTATDESTSFDVWWNIFDGLHAAVGYRTEMWIADGATGPFGFAVGLGAPVISSWINEVVSDSAYNPDTDYKDGNRGIMEPMGRPSAIAVTGHGDDTAHDVAPIPAATSLTEWWINN
jgi:hypothetical protein